jgi:hypothetical protein
MTVAAPKAAASEAGTDLEELLVILGTDDMIFVITFPIKFCKREERWKQEMEAMPTVSQSNGR